MMTIIEPALGLLYMAAIVFCLTYKDWKRWNSSRSQAGEQQA